MFAESSFPKSRTQVISLLSLFALGFLAWCATNPATGKRQVMLMSEAQESELGKEADPQITKEYGLYEDAALSRYVDTVGQRLAAVSHRPEIAWEFKVVDSPVVNAFALPGGYVYVTRGILAHFNSEAELAAVLGHEIGHVTARHTAARVSKAQLMGLTLGLGGILVPRFNDFSNIAETGLGVMFLKFSRNDEKQADDLGVVYAAKAGYNPQAAIEVFKMLEKVSGLSERSPLPNWLSTHPAPENRQERIKIATADYKGKTGVVNRREYLEHIDGIAFGEDPNEGFMKDSWFIHPQLGFKIHFPDGWKVQNTKQFVLAVDPGEAAALKLTMTGERESARRNADRVVEKEGGRMVEGRSERINGNDAYVAVAAYPGEQGRAGRTNLNAFIDFNGRIFRIEGLEKTGTVDRYRGTLLSGMRSFDELGRGEAGTVRVERVALYRLRRQMTLQDVIRSHSNGTASPEEVAVLNNVTLDETLQSSTTVKVVQR